MSLFPEFRLARGAPLVLIPQPMPLGVFGELGQYTLRLKESIGYADRTSQEFEPNWSPPLCSKRRPESDVTEGRAAPGLGLGQSDGTAGTPVVNILSGNSAPSDASIAVQYDGRWFWIADTDFRSKSIFASVMMMFSISDIGAKANGTIVTIPANGGQ